MTELMMAGAAGFLLGWFVISAWLRRVVRVAEGAYQSEVRRMIAERNATPALRDDTRLLADLDYLARYWRQPGVGDFAPKDLAVEFAEELERAAAALRTPGVDLPDGGQQ